MDSDGETQIQVSVRDHSDGRKYVLTEAEAEALAKAEFIENLVESDVEMSSEGWKNVIRPLLKSVKKREDEIRKSPGRQVKAA